MRYTLDTEFDGHGGPLISLALVPEHRESDEDAFYLVVNDGYNFAYIQDDWVRENVIPILYHKIPVDDRHCEEFRVGAHIRDWLSNDPHPMIIADSPVDIWRFCELISSTEDYEWQNTGFSKMSFEVHNVDCWPNDLGPDAVQHNAYWDAVALWAKIDR